MTSRQIHLLIPALLLALAGCGGGNDNPAPPENEPVVIDISAHCPLPTVSHFFIATQDGQSVASKEDYVKAAVKWVAPGGQTVQESLGARIRGRGNSTWDMPKKPYKLKLDDKTELLGLPAGKDWAVLANYADKTLLRNELTFCIARTLALPFTPNSSMLEITLNGQYDGLYQLTDKAYPIEERMKEDARQTPAAEDGHFNDAFILEIDFALRQDHWFHSLGGIPWNFDSDTDADQRTRIQNWINELEAIILDDQDSRRYDKVAERVDLQSLADFFLLNELTSNVDTYLSSTYAYRLQDGRLTFGPVWDADQTLAHFRYFDQESGQVTIHNETPKGWLFQKRPHSWYVQKMLEEPRFAQLVHERWGWLSERIPSFHKFILDSASALDAAQQRNFIRWPILDELVFTNAQALGSYEAEVNYMAGWMNQRATWIDGHIHELTTAKSRH